MSCKKSFEHWIKRKEERWARFDKVKRPRYGVIQEITPLDKRKFYQVWQVAWVLGRQRLLEEAGGEREPIPDEKLKQMWITSGLGKEFGRAVERWHGIGY